MDAWTGFVLWFVWTLFVFWVGVFMHWWVTRKQRRVLKVYRLREQERRWLNRPIE